MKYPDLTKCQSDPDFAGEQPQEPFMVHDVGVNHLHDFMERSVQILFDFYQEDHNLPVLKGLGG